MRIYYYNVSKNPILAYTVIFYLKIVDSNIRNLYDYERSHKKFQIPSSIIDDPTSDLNYTKEFLKNT